MSYIDIVVTAAYPDRIEIPAAGSSLRTYMNGRWNYEVAVIGSDLKPEDFQRFLRDNKVFRVNITEDTG